MRLFKRSCVGLSNKELFDQIKLDKASEFKRKTDDEYEYVAREHGYDYVPPSQYVPSHSMESSINEVETTARIQEPQSDISGSFDEEQFLRNLSRREQQQYHQQMRTRKGAQLDIVEENPSFEVTENQYHSHRQRQLSGRGGGGHDKQRYWDEEPESPYHGVSHKQKRIHREVRDPPPPEPYPSRKHHLSAVLSEDTEDDDDVGLSPGIRKVPTAYSFLSEDSDEQYLAERTNSRYDLSQDEHEVYKVASRGARSKGGKSKSSSGNSKKSRFTGWGESETSFNDRWRKRRDDGDIVQQTRRMGLEDYESRLGRDGRDRPRSRLDVPEERHPPHRGRHSPAADDYDLRRNRSERSGGNRDNRSRGRSRSPHAMERQRSSSRERHYAEDPYYQEEVRDEPPPVVIGRFPPEMAGFSPDTGRNPYPQRAPSPQPSKSEKKKSRGFLGMIRDSVRGKKEKDSMAKTNRPRPPPNAAGGKSSSIFAQRPQSMRSDVSFEYEDRIPYRYDGQERRAYEDTAEVGGFRGDLDPREPYWPDEERHPTRRTRSRSPAHITRVVPKTRTRSRSPSNTIPRTRSNNSGVPFETTRPSAPQLRFNPDMRKRPVPMAHSMMKHQYPISPKGRLEGKNSAWAHKTKDVLSPQNGRFLDTPPYACYHV